MPFNPNPQDGRQPYLPTFQEVMLTYEYEDSMRLPSYQGRQLGRYHPYLRRSPPRLEGPSSMTRYMNTIYDEECVFLEVPSFAPPRNALIAAPEAPRIGADVAAQVPPIVLNLPQNPVAGQGRQQLGEVRVNWFGDSVMETFIQGVRHAIMAEAGANTDPAQNREPAAQSGDDVTVETDLDHTLYGSVP